MSAMMLFIGMCLAGCASMTLANLDMVEGPKQVRQGQDIDPNTVTIWGIYKNGDRKAVTVNKSGITFDKHTPGHQIVKVMVGIFTKHEAVFETEVTALRSLIITSPPSTVLFIPGNDPNPKWPGLAVWGVWDQLGNAKIDTASLEFSGFMKDRPGKQTVTVSYEGASAAFGVEVMALAGIEMIMPPRKTDYMLGDAIDLTALEVYGNYTSSNHNTERLLVPIERFMLSGFD
jgi:hypothetical protein